MTLERSPKKTKQELCYQCEGKGYTEIRDCAGEIQRTETCSFCAGKGYSDRQTKERNKELFN
ncbi:hypothetical protein I4641_11315 [Waterburya agarophytonicola K14]|uniref:Molecular chaperone DnaJ n=1 Tax=Waterburya agarophytonicola KI4 TaxID=2874699 RepID=A0A964FFX9_9CYAN|nr:hypothetical protein [Waterburya agarophytonicola]MCC0177567.1 hypothetical protein [Waterburya agarophytonicola KI4]